MTTPKNAPTKVTPTTAADEARIKRDEAAAAAPEKAAAVKQKAELAVAVNLVVMTGDDGKLVDVLPDTVFEPAAIDVDFLKKQGAIRAPTEAEIALYERAQKAKAAAAASDDETLG